jgi:hypothetical protein
MALLLTCPAQHRRALSTAGPDAPSNLAFLTVERSPPRHVFLSSTELSNSWHSLMHARNVGDKLTESQERTHRTGPPGSRTALRGGPWPVRPAGATASASHAPSAASAAPGRPPAAAQPRPRAQVCGARRRSLRRRETPPHLPDMLRLPLMWLRPGLSWHTRAPMRRCSGPRVRLRCIDTGSAPQPLICTDAHAFPAGSRVRAHDPRL